MAKRNILDILEEKLAHLLTCNLLPGKDNQEEKLTEQEWEKIKKFFQGYIK